MKKWIITALSALLMVSALGIAGCGPGDATKINATEQQKKKPPGHAQAAEAMQKAQQSGTKKVKKK